MRDTMVHRPRSALLCATRGLLLAAAGLLAASCARSDLDSPGDPRFPPGATPDLAGAAETEDLSAMVGAADLAQAGAPDLSQSLPPDLASSGPRDLAQAPADLAKITGCRVVPQSGCPAGQKCTTENGSTSVCDPAGPDARGDACTTTAGVDSCAAGSVCIDEGKGQTQCRAFCVYDSDCGARSQCAYDVGTRFSVCSQACNPIYPGAGCHAGLGCYAFADEHTDCLPAGTSTRAAPCTSKLDCQGGMVCYGPLGASQCRRVCRKGDSSACSGGDTCQGLIGWSLYGLCCPAGGC